MTKKWYVLLAVVLIAGSILWSLFAILLAATNLFEINFPVTFLTCAFAILAGALIFKFIHEGKIK
jgi:hypothetical protein